MNAIERNRRGVQDYAAKKQQALERAERLRAERRRESQEEDALDAHTYSTPIKNNPRRDMSERHYQRSDAAYTIADNAQADALAALEGLVNTGPSSPSPTSAYQQYTRHQGGHTADALDGLMQKEGTPSRESRDPVAYEGRGFGRRQVSREPPARSLDPPRPPP